MVKLGAEHAKLGIIFGGPAWMLRNPTEGLPYIPTAVSCFYMEHFGQHSLHGLLETPDRVCNFEETPIHIHQPWFLKCPAYLWLVSGGSAFEIICGGPHSNKKSVMQPEVVECLKLEGSPLKTNLKRYRASHQRFHGLVHRPL